MTMHTTPRRPSHPLVEAQPYFVTTRAARGTSPFVRASATVAVHALLESRARYGFLLLAYVFMPDHAHFVVVPALEFEISQTMRVIKGGIARAVNQLAQSKGAIWQQGFYDRVARGIDDLNAYVAYVYENPVRAGLVSDSGTYAWSSARTFDELDYPRYLHGDFR